MKRIDYALRHLSLLILLALIAAPRALAAPAEDEPIDPRDSVLTVDGPYVWHQPDGSVRIIGVDLRGEVTDTTYAALPEDFRLHVCDHQGRYAFDVPLHHVERPSWHNEQPEKLFVMSDPHAKLDCVVSLLRAGGVVDEDLRWSYGTNHLMIIGDIFDRGYDATQIFWLVYKLEQEAADAGGQVSFLLGNHEPLVMGNDLRYTKPKYKLLAERLGLSYPQLWGPDTELGRWLGTRNTMQIVGRDLFVHAGLSLKFHALGLSIPTVNEEMSRALYMEKRARREFAILTKFLYGNDGPVWYRGLVRTDEKYAPPSQAELQAVLDSYGVAHVIVGHTIFDDISTFYEGLVIDVNVDNEVNRDAGRGRAVLIEGDQYYVVGDAGVMRPLF